MIRSILIAPMVFLLIGCAQAQPFPQVIDEDLVITLQRTACFGSCPDYTVTIDGKGNVVFSTAEASYPGEFEVHRAFSRSDGILFAGVHKDTIDPDLVRKLVDQFRHAEFFELEDEYRAQITSNPAYILTIDTGTASKTVVDYVGDRVGMPESVTKLQDAVDKVAGSARWVKGADGLVDWLEKNDFDFRADFVRTLVLESALEDADDRTILALIERGVDLHAMTKHPWGRDDVVLGRELLVAAVQTGRAGLFSSLVDLGWMKNVDTQKLEEEFAWNSGGCSPALVRAFAAQGLSIDAAGGEDRTALANLRDSYRCDYNDELKVETAEALLSLGADPNKQDADGETAIFAVEYPPLLDLLYRKGADPTVLNKEGHSAALSSWTDEIVLRHLNEGAPPIGRYYDGRTLREQMKFRPMPQVEQWLDANGFD